MLHSTTKAALFGLSVSAAVFSASLQNNVSVVTDPLYHSTFTKPASGVLAKKALSSVWQMVSATHFSNSTVFAVTPAWEQTTRDTLIYDASGNRIVFKTSTAGSGWGTDSLESMDSLVYSNGDLSEVFSFLDYFGGTFTSGTHTVFTFTNRDGGGTSIGIQYVWDNVKNDWLVSLKDSVLYSTAVNGSYPLNLYSGFLEEFTYEYDTVTSTWNLFSHNKKIAGECTETTLVFGGRGQIDSTGALIDTAGVSGKFVDIKEILIYSSSDWISDNIIESSILIKDTTASEYKNYYKMTRSADRTEFLMWDISSDIINSKTISLLDAQGNDTATFYCTLDTATQTWDTMSYHYNRTYDVNGNNTETVQSYISSQSSTCYILAKDSNTFILANTPVARSVKANSCNKISIVKTNNSVCFNGNGITRINLYDVSGRLIKSITQQPSSSVSLDLLHNRGYSSGTYIAELILTDGKMSVPFSIMR